MGWDGWAVQDETGRTEEIHILPLDEHGEIMKGHVAEQSCRCMPELDPGDSPCPIYVHQMEQ